MFEVHRIRSKHILTCRHGRIERRFTAEWMEQCRCRIKPRAAAMDHERFHKIALQWLWRLMSPCWHLNLLFLHPLLMRSNWKTHTKPTPTRRWWPENVCPFSNKLSEKNRNELLIKKEKLSLDGHSTSIASLFVCLPIYVAFGFVRTRQLKAPKRLNNDKKIRKRAASHVNEQRQKRQLKFSIFISFRNFSKLKTPKAY